MTYRWSRAQSSFPAWLLLGGFLCLMAAEESARESEKAARPPAGSYLRFEESGRGEGHLDTAVTTFHGKDGVQVDLIAAVHVGDKAYYEALSRRFESYDKLLFELIKSKDADLSKLGESRGLLSAFQRGLKGALGLEFQLDGIDYTRPNFVHADLDPETFARLQEEKGESIVGLLFKAALKSMEGGAGKSQPNPLALLITLFSPNNERALKLLFARQIEDMEALLAGFEEGTKDGSVLVVERNRAALKALHRTLAAGHKKVAIFYGAAHMPDMEMRLKRELKLEKGATEWLTAWDIRKPGSAAPERGEGEAAEAAPKPASDGGASKESSGGAPSKDEPSPEAKPSDPKPQDVSGDVPGPR